MSEAMRERQDNSGNIKVTVAMPVYNAGKHLRLAVLSIVRQTQQNWELLIIDDGSTDNALASISDIKDARIRILQDGENKGLAKRLNEAIELARGKYFARMDQDDVSYPDRFARQVKALQDDDSLDLVATRAILIDEDNRPAGIFPAAITHREICARPWRGFYFPHPTWMGKTGWFRKHQYRIPGPYLCEDQELLLRSYSESKFATINEVLFAYRIRKKINWRKLYGTRKSVLRVQLSCFRRTRQWAWMLLAIFAAVGRVMGDGGKMLLQTFSLSRSAKLPVPLLLQWQEILELLNINNIEHVGGAERGESR